MEIDYRAIGKRIRCARLEAGLTQESLSEMVDITPVYLSCIERGRARASLEVVVNIAGALKITTDTILSEHTAELAIPSDGC